MSCSVEIGPIRPPSEAWSLLLRVTRNCPWNRCTFCPVYKGSRFSIRSVDEVLADIDCFAWMAGEIRRQSEQMGKGGRVNGAVVRAASFSPLLGPGAAQLAAFLARGGRHAFLQDANSLVMRPPELLKVLRHLGSAFPTIERITSYARAHTLTRRKPEDLAALRRAGLNRIHVGLESGSDAVLELVRKKASAERQIEAGLRAKAAGMELSHYVMPGLGGRRLSAEHVAGTVHVLNAVAPQFIRLRTTAVSPGTALEEQVEAGELAPMDDEEVVAEIRALIAGIEGPGTLQSDHVLNLLPELEGELPAERGRLLAVIDRFQGLEPRLRRAFIIGRRAGVLSHLEHLERPELRARALELLTRVEQSYGDDLAGAVRDLMTRFI